MNSYATGAGWLIVEKTELEWREAELVEATRLAVVGDLPSQWVRCACCGGLKRRAFMASPTYPLAEPGDPSADCWLPNHTHVWVTPWLGTE